MPLSVRAPTSSVLTYDPRGAVHGSVYKARHIRSRAIVPLPTEVETLAGLMKFLKSRASFDTSKMLAKGLSSPASSPHRPLVQLVQYVCKFGQAPDVMLYGDLSDYAIPTGCYIKIRWAHVSCVWSTTSPAGAILHASETIPGVVRYPQALLPEGRFQARTPGGDQATRSGG